MVYNTYNSDEKTRGRRSDGGRERERERERRREREKEREGE